MEGKEGKKGYGERRGWRKGQRVAVPPPPIALQLGQMAHLPHHSSYGIGWVWYNACKMPADGIREILLTNALYVKCLTQRGMTVKFKGNRCTLLSVLDLYLMACLKLHIKRNEQKLQNRFIMETVSGIEVWYKELCNFSA